MDGIALKALEELKKGIREDNFYMTINSKTQDYAHKI